MSRPLPPRARSFASMILAAFGLLAVAAGPAAAAKNYGLVGVLGGSFNAPRGAAVDNGAGGSAGDVYITDAENHRVVKFNATGTELAELTYTPTPAEVAEGKKPLGVVFWDAVDPTTGDVYASNIGGGAVTRFSSAGAFLSQITEATLAAAPVHEGFAPSGVAVDGSGKLYVADLANHVIDRFSSTGVYETQFADESATALSIALDTTAGPNSGDIYVTDSNGGGGASIRAFNAAAGTPVTPAGCASNVIDSSEPRAVAVDPVDGAVIAGEIGAGGFQLTRYPTPCSGEPLSFGAGTFAGESTGVAVSGVAPTQHTIYAVSNEGTTANIFEEGEGPETPVSEPATGVTAGNVMLHGELNPGASTAAVHYYFAYNTGGTCTGGSTTPNPPGEAEGNHQNVATEVTGLQPNTQYTFCLFASNPFGVGEGSAESFTTAGLAPAVASESVSGVTPFAARLEAAVNPENDTTECHFQYGTASVGEHEVECEQGNALNGGEQSVGANIAGLTPNAPYHYRVVLKNATGTTEGVTPEQEFTTLQAFPPTLDSETVSGISPTEATLEAQINPDYQETPYFFEYATNSELTGATTVAGAAPLTASFGDQLASVVLTGLTAGETYYYRVVASNATPPASIGVVQSFTTPGAPVVSAAAPQGITRTAAVLSGTVNPVGAQTTYHFAYISQSGYEAALAEGAADPYAAGHSTAPVALGPDRAVHPTGGILIQELSPGTTYHYTLVATNQFGTVSATGATFTTASPAQPLVQTGSASNVTQNAATIAATVNGNGLQTSYAFEIGTGGGYGPAIELGNVNANESEVAVTFALSGLLPGTTYHYRVTATNVDGTSYGQDRAFTTTAAANALTTPPVPLLAIPSNNPAARVITQTPTRAQKLAKALKACKKYKPKRRRARCEAQARKKYAPAKKRK
jgi:hypothetical protein